MSHIQKIADRMRQEPECLLSHGESLHYKKGQDLFYQGHDPCGLFWIMTGRVALIHIEPNGEHLEERKKGDILGLEELLKGETFMYTAQAVTGCKICFIPKVIFLDWLEMKKQ